MLFRLQIVKETMSTSSLFISGINFKLLLKTGCLRTYLSPEILLNQIPWQVKVLRRSFLGEDSVDVFLVCSPASNESHWTCEAKTTFTLEPIGAGQQPYEKSFPMTEFSKDANTIGIAPFTTWNELMKYAHNDEVKFNVQLAANPILYMTPTNTVHFGAIFRHTIENINQLETESTQEIQLEGARWYVEFSKKGGHLLGVSLRRIRDPQNDNWTWETQFSFKIESFGRNVHPILRDSHNCFSSRSAKSIHFIGLNELLDPVKQYVKNDAIIVEIDLKVSAPKPLWDIGQV